MDLIVVDRRQQITMVVVMFRQQLVIMLIMNRRPFHHRDTILQVLMLAD
jgi:hypothetical protein